MRKFNPSHSTMARVTMLLFALVAVMVEDTAQKLIPLRKPIDLSGLARTGIIKGKERERGTLRTTYRYPMSGFPKLLEVIKAIMAASEWLVKPAPVPASVVHGEVYKIDYTNANEDVPEDERQPPIQYYYSVKFADTKGELYRLDFYGKGDKYKIADDNSLYHYKGKSNQVKRVLKLVKSKRYREAEQQADYPIYR